MKKIYAPWREKYVTRDKEKIDGCVFCHQLEKNTDDEFFILKRLKHTFIMMNLYPYNGGHVMVLPLAHKATLEECTHEERCELMDGINLSIQALTQELKPNGFNVGLNMGKAGGGGIPTHLHFHVVHRWEGDTNFMPLLCNTKPVSTDLKTLFEQLKSRF